MNQTLGEHGAAEGGRDHGAAMLTSLEIWGYGFLFVTIINLSSVTGILFFPLMKKSFFTIAMRSMIGLAIGSLSGSAIFHLIPQAFQLPHASAKNYTFIACFIWLSIWLVMMLESTIKIVVTARANNRLKKEAGKNDANMMLNRRPNNNVLENGSVTNGDIHIVKDADEPDETTCDGSVIEPLNPKPENGALGSMLKYADMDVHHSTLSLNKTVDDNVTTADVVDSDKSIKTVAWIVIIGDSLHNFIDGVSIGAGFTQSFSTGLILSLTVICEEFPHELGDFAILINSGLSVKKALLFNFLSAITCYLGLALGILLGKIEFEYLIFAFAAGIFLYVALADMVPEVTEAIDKASAKGSCHAWLTLLNYHIGIIVGILILYILAINAPT